MQRGALSLTHDACLSFLSYHINKLSIFKIQMASFAQSFTIGSYLVKVGEPSAPTWSPKCLLCMGAELGTVTSQGKR